MSRNPIDQMRGYFYQYDYSIRRLLELPTDSSEVTVEGVEDLDIQGLNENTAIQCKYHEKSSYRNSLIGKPIRLMLRHFSTTRKNGAAQFRYKLYGHYKDEHSRLPEKLDVPSLKTSFLTYKPKKKPQVLEHERLGLSDSELQMFLDSLDIDIRAESFDTNHRMVLQGLKDAFNCSPTEAEFVLYNAALRVIRDLAISNEIDRRRISRGQFIARIDKRELIFNEWFLALKERNAFIKHVRRSILSNGLNTSPFERVVCIDAENDSIAKLKEIVLLVCKKWSKIAKSEPDCFCPYVCLVGAKPDTLAALKDQLRSEGYLLIDGHDFLGGSFCPRSLARTPSFHNAIKVKFINDLANLGDLWPQLTRTKEIYQFFRQNPAVDHSDIPVGVHSVSIRVQSLNDVLELLK